MIVTKYKIYSLINPETGEIIPYTPDLAAQVEELHSLMVVLATAQAQRDLCSLQPLEPSGDGLARALFGGGLGATMNTPFVIQFSNLDDFCNEIIEADLAHTEVVRVWGADFFVPFGNTLPGGRRYDCVIAQAIKAPNTTLQTCLVIGGYQELYDEPFGEMAEVVHCVVKENIHQALKLVTDYITQKTGAATRPGQIETGLTALTIHKVPWGGFKHIYDQFQGEPK